MDCSINNENYSDITRSSISKNNTFNFIYFTKKAKSYEETQYVSTVFKSRYAKHTMTTLL